MARNYEDVLDQLRSAGLRVDHLDTTGTMKRVRVEGDRELRGWYVLHEMRLDDGEDLITGSFGVWRGNNNHAQKVEVRKTTMTDEQRAAIRQRQREYRAKAERLRKENAQRAAERARQMWIRQSETGESQYLAKKGVGGHGVRYSPNGALVIPMCDVGGHVHGLQIIRDKPKTNEREKEYWPAGLAKQGHFHLIGGVPTWILLVAEGYATAASLYEATGHPVAVAFDANNLVPVAQALHKKYGYAKILICADDDRFQRCGACKGPVDLHYNATLCPACDQPHGKGNAGISSASAAALSAHGEWVVPTFADDAKRVNEFTSRGRRLSDFNDLHALEGLHAVRACIEARTTELSWGVSETRAPTPTQKGAGKDVMRPIDSTAELVDRYSLIYGNGGFAFDGYHHRIVKLTDIRDACVSKQVYTWWTERPDRKVVQPENVGFDPTERDPTITCNLWSGWPTERDRLGKCDMLLNLLEYLCSADSQSPELSQWLIKWIAYPLQHPGAKMKTTIVMHGPQGTGKNLLWETVMAIYGHYGNVINQDALEDKFNDWASKKLFLIADEVVARQELYQVKNKLKTFVTGDFIRINPKGSMAYQERNHVNLVFLSNETLPTVLEEDDRRHCVIWTPPKMDPAFYQKVLEEIDNNGAAALYDYMLEVDLGDFGPGTLPPISDAKSELINQSLDSTSRFGFALVNEEFDGVKLAPCLAQDVYNLYRWYCDTQGIKAAPQPKLLSILDRKFGSSPVRKRYYQGEFNDVKQGSILMFGFEVEAGHDERAWLGQKVEAFKSSSSALRGKLHG